jgi:hypothetical protein
MPRRGDIAQQVSPRLDRFPIPVADSGRLLAAVDTHTDHHQQAQFLLFQVSGDVGPQRRGQHLAGAVADDVVAQGPARVGGVVVGRFGVVTCGEKESAVPTSAPTPVSTRTTSTFRSSRRCAPSCSASPRLIHSRFRSLLRVYVTV